MKTLLTLIIIFGFISPCFADKKLDTYILKKEYEKALKYIESDLKGVQDEYVVYNIGYANEQLGFNEKAISTYLNLIIAQPSNTLALSSVARIYYKMKLYERAYSYSIKLIKVDSLTEDYNLQHALICLQVGKIDEAQKLFETLDYSEQSKKALATIYFDKKLYSQAIPYLLFVFLNQKDDSIALKLSSCYQNLNKSDSSIYYLKLIKSITNENRLILARLYAQSGQCNQALIEYNKLNVKYFECIDFSYQGDCCQKQGENVRALVFYEYSLKKNTDTKQILDIKLKITKIYLDLKNFTNALKYIRELEQQNLGVDFDKVMIQYFNGINNYERTTYFANRVLKEDSTDISLFFILINAYEKQGMTTKANQLTDKLTKLQQNPENILKIANYYYENNNYLKALELYEKSYITTGGIKVLEKIAICADNLKDYDKAKDASETLLRKKVESVECRKILYKIALNKTKFLEASIHLEFLLQKDSSLKYYEDLAICYKNLEKKEKLLIVDAKIVELDKNNIESRERLASSFMSLSKKQEALKIYFELEKLRKFSESDYFKMISLLDKDEATSIVYLKKIITINPANIDAHKQLGDIFYSQKKYDEAYSEYNYIMSIADITRVDYLKNFCYIVIIKKNSQEIIRIGSRAFILGQTDHYILTNLAETYYDLSDFSKSLETYSKLSLEKIDASILLKIAICQEKTNAISAAILSYEQYVILCPTAKNEFLSLAELYNKMSKHNQAISTYKTYLKKYKDEKLSIKVAQYEYQRNNFVEAVKYFSEVNVFKDPEQLFMFGNSMYMTKQYDDAVSILSACENFNNFSKSSEAYKLIAISYEQLKNTEKAIQYYKTYSQWCPKDSTICFHTAELQEQLHISLAKDIYEVNIKKFPNDSRNHLRLAEIYYKFNDFKKAKLSYEKVKTLNDTVSVDFLLKLAHCYQETNDRDNEIKTYKNVLMKDNQNFTANKFLGIYCYEAGELKEGLEYLELAKSQNYSDPDMLYILGRIYLKDEFSNEGILFLQSAKKQKPNDCKIRLFTIESYKKYGKLREACLEIEELLKIERSFKNLDIYCKTLFELKNYQAAENIGIEMRKQEPSNIELLMFLGKIKIEQAQLDDALEYFKMVSYVRSKYAPAICKRADIYLMKKDVELAKEYYLKAIKADPKYAISYYRIAMIYKYSGDTKQYMDNISKAVSIDSTNSVISEEIKRSKQN